MLVNAYNCVYRPSVCFNSVFSPHSLQQSRELVCFKDIYPAAPHHYLVVPIVHIGNCHSLHRGNIGLGQLLDGYCRYQLLLLSICILPRMLPLKSLKVLLLILFLTLLYLLSVGYSYHVLLLR